MNLTPRQRRAQHRERNKSLVDLNLVSLIDVFTILIFFLLSNSTEVGTLPSTKAVNLPESSAEKSPRETLVVVVSNTEILVEGRKVAAVTDIMGMKGDVIAPLKSELDLQASRQVVRRENQAQNKAITIMGDQDIPYQLLRKVMATCAQANFQDVSFAVRRKNAS